MSEANQIERQVVARCPRRPPFQMDVREGDEWAFHGNDHVSYRTVVLIGSKLISYRPGRSGKVRAVAKATFCRWVRGASLEFATDWNNRRHGE